MFNCGNLLHVCCSLQQSRFSLWHFVIKCIMKYFWIKTWMELWVYKNQSYKYYIVSLIYKSFFFFKNHLNMNHFLLKSCFDFRMLFFDQKLPVVNTFLRVKFVQKITTAWKKYFLGKVTFVPAKGDLKYDIPWVANIYWGRKWSDFYLYLETSLFRFLLWTISPFFQLFGKRLWFVSAHGLVTLVTPIISMLIKHLLSYSAPLPKFFNRFQCVKIKRRILLIK